MIPYREKMTEFDSSKIGDYARCPRYFFYRHILGWGSEGVNKDLIYGEAHHRARESMLHTGFVDGWKEQAMQKFNEYWREYYGDITDLDMYPKSPIGELESLILYEKTYKDHMNFKLMHLNGVPSTEIYGTVPITADRKLHFRIDAIGTNDNNSVVCMDHKSSCSNNPVYQSAWSLSNQMMTYYHALNCLVDPGTVYGVIVDLTIFRKSGHDLIRIPIRKTLAMMDEWLHNVVKWTEEMERDIENTFAPSAVEQDVMPTFKRNDHGCTAYYRKCAYFDLCNAWPNPLQRCEDVPNGFKVDYWDPGDRGKESNNFVEV